MAIRLVTFDALHTLITPRFPIHVQYAQIFEPHLGPLSPDALRTSFKASLKRMQIDAPVYASGADAWWAEIIRATALGAGAEPSAIDRSLHAIVPALMHRFSSRDGYKTLPDALSTLQRLRSSPGRRLGIVSNADARMHAVLKDLGMTPLLDFVLLSEDVHMEKPARAIFEQACAHAGVPSRAALHVGDELYADYLGARASGMHALLVRHAETESEPGEDLRDVEVVPGLEDVVAWVERRDQRGS